MAENANCTVYIGNLDERVTDRVLYDILIQAGRVVDLYIPREKETDKPKGYAFAQYEAEEIAEYAVKLFSGLVILYNKTLKFAISGKDKSSVNLPMATSPSLSSSLKPRPHSSSYDEMRVSSNSTRLSTSYRFSDHQVNYAQVRISPSSSVHQPKGNSYQKHNDNYDYSRRVFGAALDSITHSRLGRYETRNQNSYHPYY